MTKRRKHSPAFKAKVALAAVQERIRGLEALVELLQGQLEQEQQRNAALVIELKPGQTSTQERRGAPVAVLAIVKGSGGTLAPAAPSSQSSWIGESQFPKPADPNDVVSFAFGVLGLSLALGIP